MRRFLLLLIAATAAVATLGAQDSVTIKADPSDLTRPVSTLLNQLRAHEKIPVSYEDPRYEKRGDMGGPNVSFTYLPQEIKAQNGGDLVIRRMLREYSASGGLTFAVTSEEGRFYVGPAEVKNASGARTPASSILDTVIDISPGERDGSQFLRAICDAVQERTGYKVGIGPSAPTNALQHYSTHDGVDNQTARAALVKLLDSVAPRGSFVWDLYYDPAYYRDPDRGGYGLNFAYVGSAGPVRR
jgi:hypothetical protein